MIQFSMSVPNQVRVASEHPSRDLFRFPLFMENIPRNLFIYSIENSTAVTTCAAEYQYCEDQLPNG